MQVNGKWQTKTRYSVLVLMTCGCLQVKQVKNIDTNKGTGMCCTWAGARRGCRNEERAALLELKKIIQEHSHDWYLLRELCMRDATGRLTKVDCMLISARVANLTAAQQTSAMLAIELDGTSHRYKPFEYGKDRIEAMEDQLERDRCKDAELRRRRIASIRISGSNDWAQLLRLMKVVASFD